MKVSTLGLTTQDVKRLVGETLEMTNWSKMDIPGIVGSSENCPISNYVRKMLHTMEVDYAHVLTGPDFVNVYSKNQIIHIPLPTEATEFIRRFDSGADHQSLNGEQLNAMRDAGILCA